MDFNYSSTTKDEEIHHAMISLSVIIVAAILQTSFDTKCQRQIVGIMENLDYRLVNIWFMVVQDLFN